MNNNKMAIYYRSNGKWTPYKNNSGSVRTFTSSRELNRFLKSDNFSYDKNHVLKSRVSVRKYQA